MNRFLDFMARHRHGTTTSDYSSQNSQDKKEPFQPEKDCIPLKDSYDFIAVPHQKKVLPDLPSSLEKIVYCTKEELSIPEQTLSNKDCSGIVHYAQDVAQTLKNYLAHLNTDAKNKERNKQLCHTIRKCHKNLLRIAKYVPSKLSASLLKTVPSVLEQLISTKTEKPYWIHVENSRTLTETGFSSTLTEMEAIEWLSRAEYSWDKTFAIQEGTYEMYLLAGKCLRRKTDILGSTLKSHNRISYDRMQEYYAKARSLAKTKSEKMLKNVKQEISDFGRRIRQYKSVKVLNPKH